ncbi:MAG: GNAT family N-acetyltransferase [Oscillospiraceae bacterium]|nr:GNAT family N-acetyltransferase [Oscillospiraceae bacterium]
MIRKITKPEELNTDLLRQSWRGRNMYAYYKAYGLHYDFCEFYQVGRNGILLRFNSTVLLVTPGPDNFDTDEIVGLALFLRMHKPFRIETDFAMQLCPYLPEYVPLHRTTFQLHPGQENEISTQDAEQRINFNPELEQVYRILQAGFPHLQDYPLWLTDMSHRCRHGISHVLTYQDSTTASLVFDIDDLVLVGQVATLPEARGLGHARMFLRWLAGWLAGFHKTAVLYALDIRESFYREIGFEAIAEEFVLERSAQAEDFNLNLNNSDSIMKGLLEDV